MSTTPHDHVLIDYENVQLELAFQLAAALFKVWVFVGALQSKVKFDGLDKPSSVLTRDLVQRRRP